MKIKKYSEFLESLQIDLSDQLVDIMESLNMWHDVLLASIGAQKEDELKKKGISLLSFKSNKAIGA